jgi:hypothetical protein
LTVARGCALLASFAAIAIGVVQLRAEQARCAARLLGMEAQKVSLRRELWSLQARTARLRAPQRVHDRVAFFETGLVPPGFEEPAGRVERVVSNRQSETSTLRR